MSLSESNVLELLGTQRPQIHHLPPDVHSHARATEAIEFMEALGRPFDESQAVTMTSALGTRADGSWSAFEVADVEPRQNGKGNKIEGREVSGLFLWGEQLQIHTAHEFPTANEAFLRMVALIEANRDLEKRVQRIRFANGEQGVELKNGARLKYRARTGGAGRGFAGADLVVIDEAFAMMAEHAAAIMPTLSASPNPQLWLASSGGLAKSTLLWALRKRALSGNAGRLAYCEHTAEDIALGADGRVVSRSIDVADRRLWAMANPAIGTRISWDYVEAEFAAMPADQFARERLGVFDPLPDDQASPKLDPDRWRATATAAGPPTGRVTLGYDVDLDGRSASITLAAGTISAPYMETLEHRSDVGWLADALVRLVKATDPLAVGYNAAGPALQQVGALSVAFREAGLPSDLLTPLSAADYRAACGTVLTSVNEATLTRPKVKQTPLDNAACDAAERTLGEGWVWDRRQASVPISPLVAGTAAVYLLPTSDGPSDPVFFY